MNRITSCYRSYLSLSLSLPLSFSLSLSLSLSLSPSLSLSLPSSLLLPPSPPPVRVPLSLLQGPSLNLSLSLRGTRSCDSRRVPAASGGAGTAGWPGAAAIAVAWRRGRAYAIGFRDASHVEIVRA